MKKLHFENTIIDFHRGPCALHAKSERVSMFGYGYVESEKLFLIPLFGRNKNKSGCQIVGY